MDEKRQERQADEFWAWVNAEADARGLSSWRQIEIAGGVSNGTLSRRVKLSQGPTIDNCEAIATALAVPLRDVLTRGGLIDIPYQIDQIRDTDLKTLVSIMRDLPAERRLQLLDFALYLNKRDRAD